MTGKLGLSFTPILWQVSPAPCSPSWSLPHLPIGCSAEFPAALQLAIRFASFARRRSSPRQRSAVTVAEQLRPPPAVRRRFPPRQMPDSPDLHTWGQGLLVQIIDLPLCRPTTRPCTCVVQRTFAHLPAEISRLRAPSPSGCLGSPPSGTSEERRRLLRRTPPGRRACGAMMCDTAPDDVWLRYGSVGGLSAFRHRRDPPVQ
jgi:hypothetical protein